MLKFRGKKVFVQTLVLVLVLTILAACGNSGASGDSEENNDKQLKAAFITPQRLGDKGPIDLAHSGFKKGEKDFGIKTQTIEVKKGEYEETLTAMAQEGYDLVIALNPEMLDAVERVAPSFPETHFASIIGESSQPNVASILSKEQEGSFLAGVLAASMSKTNQIGFIGGVDNPEINRFYAGYQQGAKAVKPDIKVTPVYVGGFEDPTKGKELALVLYNEGKDVVYHAAAKSGLGLFEAAKETGKFAIGVDVNQNDLVPGQVLGSMEIFYNQWLYDLMKSLHEGKIKTGIVWHDLKDGMIDLTVSTPEQADIPDDVRKLIEDYKQKIINGEIKVNAVPKK